MSWLRPRPKSQEELESIRAMGWGRATLKYGFTRRWLLVFGIVLLVLWCLGHWHILTTAPDDFRDTVALVLLIGFGQGFGTWLTAVDELLMMQVSHRQR